MSTTFTRKSVSEAAINDIAAAIRGASLDYSDNAAEIVELVENNNYCAPEVIYSADAFEVCQGSDFNDVEIDDDLSFSECDNAMQCLSMEANAIVDAAYRADLAETARTISDFIESMLAEMEYETRMTAENVRGVFDFSLGDIPHDLEFDVTASNGESVSVCVWKKHGRAAFNYCGIHIQCDLSEPEEE